MRQPRITAACLAAVTVTAALALTACGASGYKKTGVKAALPSLRGMKLVDATTAAKTAGFLHVKSHDANGDRRKPYGSGWVVCFQNPGTDRSTDTGMPVDLGAVEMSETCPAQDYGHSGSGAYGGRGYDDGSNHSTYSTRRPVRPRRTSGGDDYESSSSGGTSHSTHHSSSGSRSRSRHH